MMWWRALPLLLVLGLVAVIGGQNEQWVTEDADRPVVIATLPCATNLQATSSGFVISDETVMTVAHAIYESRDFAVRDTLGRWHQATVIHMDLERDLAVLRIPGLRASSLGARPAASGDQVHMVGGAASGSIDGQVMRRVRITTEVIGDLSQRSARSGYELSFAIKGGDSGAAVIDENSDLVGLVFARSTLRQAAWATSVTEITDALNRRGAPSWTCERDSDAELFLEPKTPPEQQLP